MKNELLYKNFDNVPTRKGRGGTYSYIRWQDVADRMNEVFGINWSSEVVFQDIIGNNVIVRVKVTVLNCDNKIAFIQEGFGGAPNDNGEAGNAFKSAYSKALKDACKKWGIGLYLDDDDDSNSSSSSSHSGHKEFGLPSSMKPTSIKAPSPLPAKYPSQNSQMDTTIPPMATTVSGTFPTNPVVMPMTPVVPMTSVVPTALTASVVPFTPVAPTLTASIDIIEPMEFVEPIAPAEPIIPITTKIPKGSMPLPPGIAMATKSAPPTTPEHFMPPIMGSPFTNDVPESKTETINTGEPEYISDVQRAALQSILCIKGAEYEPLAIEAFELNNYTKRPIPDQDKLTYQEAVYVVKFGNDKFRKR